MWDGIESLRNVDGDSGGTQWWLRRIETGSDVGGRRHEGGDR